MVHMIDVCVRVAKLNCAMHCASGSDIELRNVWLVFDRFVDGNVDSVYWMMMMITEAVYFIVFVIDVPSVIQILVV